LADWQSDLKSYSHTAASPHHPGKAAIDKILASLGQQLAIRDSFAFIEALLAAKDDWLDAADEVRDLVNFYKTQIIAWRKLLAALAQFADNREALNKVPQAGAALAELIQIRDNPAPFSQVNRIEPLVATVNTVNEQLASEKREKALRSIEDKIAEVQVKLTATLVSPETSNKALRVLQDIKTGIASQTSIAQILYLQGQGGDAMDDAIAIVDAAVAAKQVSHVATPGDAAKPVTTGQPNVPAPVVKTTKVIRVAELPGKSYLSSEADVNAFIEKLRSEILLAIQSGHNVRLQ
jgi:phosphopantetheine adenylyltransferase